MPGLPKTVVSPSRRSSPLVMSRTVASCTFALPRVAAGLVSRPPTTTSQGGPDLQIALLTQLLVVDALCVVVRVAEPQAPPGCGSADIAYAKYATSTLSSPEGA
ncbi:hypothetical protein GCM10010470_63720 [Saccharopolyspora taberi]|uniref:Uncharacterized protein n=1 Tax=Saccharopolyspora taberi TaxID=60895 RepID=A0ABN3VN33_9PSEU